MLTEAEAHDTAWEFTQRDTARGPYPLRPCAVKVSLDTHNAGKRLLGCEQEFWTFIFELELPPGVVVDHDSAIVLVDPHTAKAAYFPRL